jgi:hypothetical protein
MGPRLSLFLGIWAAVGPLVGILVGSYLTTRAQRTYWVLDNKRSEYRKLLTTLTRSYSTIVNLRSQGIVSGRDEIKCEQMRIAALNVIRDRIFIAKEVKEMGLLEKWAVATHDFNKSRDYELFATQFAKVADLVRSHAAKIVE